MWILDEKAEEGPKIIKKEIIYLPDLYKIFDEILGKNNLYYINLSYTQSLYSIQ